MPLFPDHNPPVSLDKDRGDLIDLSAYRLADRAGGGPDPVIIHVIYSRDNEIYRQGRIVAADARTYARYKDPNSPDHDELVNKFGNVYADGFPLLLHRRLADVLIDAAIDMRDRHRQFTVVMDGLRTYDSGKAMEAARPDLVASGLLARAGESAHNRALAVDSKLFEHADGLVEADEMGHLDALDMRANSRFFAGPMPAEARANRLNRLRAWQRASIKNGLPIANLLSEFWDDRVPGSPADMWRILSCRALCIGTDGNPRTQPVIGALRQSLGTLHAEQEAGATSRQDFAERAHAAFRAAWDAVFGAEGRHALARVLGPGGDRPPALEEFLFHEWLDSIHDRHLEAAGYPRQAASV